MTNFDVEIIGDSPNDIANRLNDVNLAARNRTNQQLMEKAREVKADLEDTAPVDTGEYRDSWYVFPAKRNEVWVLNEADHTQYVMLPNSNFVGKAGADVPSQGILHNVKGIAQGHSSGLASDIQKEINKLISGFRK